MTKKLIIVGAGGFGREVYAWASHIEPTQSLWEFAGFLDANSSALEGYNLNVPIVGSPDKYDPTDSELFVCAIGDPEIRLAVSRNLEHRGAKYATLIHPSAVVGPNCQIGEGSILCPFAVVTTNASVGRHAILNLHSTVGHDAVLGDYVTLCDHCDVTGNCQVGDGVFLASHASILPGMRIGNHAKVGAGSAVVKNVPEHTTVMGIPAKRISTAVPDSRAG